MGSLRHRQLLLSLKYATIEASFSVPMLQLTQGHLPFAIGFAVKALGWEARGVGFLAASFFMAYVLQVPISFVLQRYLSLHAIVRLTFVANALPWFLVVLFPFIGSGARDLLFALIALVATLANAVCGVAWAASMSELVPKQIYGRFFGRRNLVYGFWTLVVLLVAGQLADLTDNSLVFFAVLYAVAATARLIGLYFFSRMTFPRVVLERQHDAARLSGFLAPLRDRNFHWLLAFNGLFGLFLYMGLPFYNVYVLRELRFSLGDLAVMTTLGNLAGLVSVNTWAPLTDRFGVKPLMAWSVILWTCLGGALWLFTGPATPWLVYPSYIVYGFMWALLQILQLTFMLKMAPAAHRTYYISTYYAVTYLLMFFGPFLGGYLLTFLPREVGQLFGQSLTRYHVVLVGSLTLCLACVALLRRVREPASSSLRQVVRHMRRSTETNPALLAVSIAQELFGGRGFETLWRESRRTLRKQANVLTDVGEELAHESWKALRRPFQRPEDAAAAAGADAADVAAGDAAGVERDAVDGADGADRGVSDRTSDST